MILSYSRVKTCCRLHSFISEHGSSHTLHRAHAVQRHVHHLAMSTVVSGREGDGARASVHTGRDAGSCWMFSTRDLMQK